MFIGIIAKSPAIGRGGYRYDVVKPLFVAFKKPLIAVPVVVIVNVNAPAASVVAVASGVFSSVVANAAMRTPASGVVPLRPREDAVPLRVTVEGATGASALLSPPPPQAATIRSQRRFFMACPLISLSR
jgi:hypothetical protein